MTLSHMSDSEPSVVRSVRLPRGLLDRLSDRAGLEHRTVNNLIIKILSESLTGTVDLDAKDSTA